MAVAARVGMPRRGVVRQAMTDGWGGWDEITVNKGEVVMPREAGYSPLSAVCEKSTCEEYVRATQFEPYVSIQEGVIAAYTIMVNM